MSCWLSGTPVFGRVPTTSQGTQAQQKTARRRGFGNRKTVYVANAAAIAVKAAIP